MQDGTLTVKLPALFSLTSTPSSKNEYTVHESTEEINETDEELDDDFLGVDRKVITFHRKNITSEVNISFEMR